jgi:SNF2 family DNA or RNA helicase
MSGDLYDFQKSGVPWLAASRTAYLADEMGLGKSVQAIRAADELGVKKLLEIGPASIRDDWAEKFDEWALMRRPTHILKPDATVRLGGDRYNLITSFEGAVKHRKELRQLPWDLIVIDEAQGLKNAQTRRARAIYGGWCRGIGGVIEKADRVWALSGGPMPNGDPRELYPHLRALLPSSIVDPHSKKVWTPGQFEANFCRIANVMGGKCVGINDADGLKQILDGWMLRRLIRDVLPDLPELRFSNLFVRPQDVDPSLAIARWPELSTELQDCLDAGGAGNLDWAMQQQVSTARRLTGLLKADLAADLVAQELKSGVLDQIVVAAFHRDVILTMMDRLKRFGAGRIMGSMPDTEKTAARKAFQAGKLRVLFIQLQAGGVGLTLTAAHHILFVESSYTPMDNYQVAARCHRIGQLYPVFARFLTLTGTIDELIQKVAVRKTNQIREVHPI